MTHIRRDERGKLSPSVDRRIVGDADRRRPQAYVDQDVKRAQYLKKLHEEKPQEPTWW